MPEAAWLPAQTITVDTAKGAIDLEPATEQEYTAWVLGLNVALMAAQDSQTAQGLLVPHLCWSSCVLIMTS